MDRFSSISAFVKAVETGSFSAAADALNMSPQLVGKLIQKLESHLGVRLLHRTTRRQSLTDYGRQFYERAKIILGELEMAENLAEAAQALPSGKLRINAPVSFGIHTLGPKLPQYLEMYPEVSVDVTLSNRAVDLVDEGYDAVFRVGKLSDSRLMARALAPYEMALCASPKYLKGRPKLNSPADLGAHECLGFSLTELRHNWSFDSPGGRVDVPISSRFSADHGELLLSAALAGLGVMLQPLELASPFIKNGDLVTLLPDFPIPARPLHVLYAPDRRLTPKLRSFLDFSINAFGSV